MEIPIFSIQNPILVNSPLLLFYEVPHADIWFSHFYLNVVQGTIVGFSRALPVLAREGVAKFWITLYKFDCRSKKCNENYLGKTGRRLEVRENYDVGKDRNPTHSSTQND